MTHVSKNMPPNRFGVTYKIIYKDKCGAVAKRNQKIRLVKEILQVQTLFWNFCISIVVLLWR